jgi:hypothetical protein
MVMEFLGAGRIRQCEQASAAFDNSTGRPPTNPTGPSGGNFAGVANPCKEDGSLRPGGDWDRPWHPQFEVWGFTYQLRSGNPLTWEELTREINEGRPFLFSWVEEETSLNHMMVAIGYHEDGGDKRVIYIDPLFDPMHVPVMASFNQYYGYSDEYTHLDDYVQIQRRTSQ